MAWGAEGVGTGDVVCPAWESASSQFGECHGDGALNVLFLGFGDPVVYKASVCLDQLRVVTQLLGGVDGGGGY